MVGYVAHGHGYAEPCVGASRVVARITHRHNARTMCYTMPVFYVGDNSMSTCDMFDMPWKEILDQSINGLH